jgi:hypothetical protein
MRAQVVRDSGYLLVRAELEHRRIIGISASSGTRDCAGGGGVRRVSLAGDGIGTAFRGVANRKVREPVRATVFQLKGLPASKAMAYALLHGSGLGHA